MGSRGLRAPARGRGRRRPLPTSSAPARGAGRGRGPCPAGAQAAAPSGAGYAECACALWPSPTRRHRHRHAAGGRAWASEAAGGVRRAGVAGGRVQNIACAYLKHCIYMIYSSATLWVRRTGALPTTGHHDTAPRRRSAPRSSISKVNNGPKCTRRAALAISAFDHPAAAAAESPCYRLPATSGGGAVG